MSNLRVITFTDKPLGNDNKLIQSCASKGIKLEIISPEGDWIVNAQKIKLLHDFINSIDNNDLLLIVDAFDVIINANPEEIISIFNELETDILFSAEANFYFRNSKLKNYYQKNYPQSDTIYRYLNSGTFIGYRDSIGTFLSEIIEANNLDPNDTLSFVPVRSDQYLYGKHFVDVSIARNTGYKITLDYHHKLFEVTGGRMRATKLPFVSKLHAFNSYKLERFFLKHLRLNKYQDNLIDLEYDESKNQFTNTVTDTNPPIIHIPGSWKFFDRVMDQLTSGKTKLEPIRLFAVIVALLTYVVSVLIPVKLKL